MSSRARTTTSSGSRRRSTCAPTTRIWSARSPARTSSRRQRRPRTLGPRRGSHTEQAPVDALHGRAGRNPELVAEQDAQAVVDEQRLRVVAAPLERLHEDPVAGLAVRRQLDETAPAFLRLRQRRSAEAEPRRCEALESVDRNIVEATPPLVQPRAVVTLEQGTAGHVIRDAGRAPRLGPLAVGD